ncbi:hypothetical protein S58_60170 [Bradyrhizobium oligotrophicum S58]|uniref:Uncharacterized protein n=2 Tax=Bradyrhizobium oligotrophicum TaxID=44255 RepID=M4ZDU2_9BRAD|nr:hypothetical protein S58_60170 [Bradyrhizobium oligotrophicum S58]
MTPVTPTPRLEPNLIRMIACRIKHPRRLAIAGDPVPLEVGEMRRQGAERNARPYACNRALTVTRRTEANRRSPLKLGRLRPEAERARTAWRPLITDNGTT